MTKRSSCKISAKALRTRSSRASSPVVVDVVGSSAVVAEDAATVQAREKIGEVVEPSPILAEEDSSAARPGPSVSRHMVVVDDEPLRRRLEDLNASHPVRVYTKRLSKSDRTSDQNRLLMSCKRYMTRQEPFPLEELLTPAERPTVAVQAFDRHGRSYNITCRKLECNSAYRLIGDWTKFLKDNGLAVLQESNARNVVKIDLWAFRSRLLTLGNTDQPGGALGLAMIHYNEEEEEPLDVARVLPPENIGLHADHVHDDALPDLNVAIDWSDEDMMDAAAGLLKLRELPMFF